jgi:uncharacterized protein YqcC (DUF446 family)
MTSTDNIEEKITEIITEMKRLGLYKKFTPGWVNDYSKQKIATGEDFAGWLQFVYLPNRQQTIAQITDRNTMIVPQAMKFFSDDIKKGKLLQLLVELDSL